MMTDVFHRYICSHE